MRDEISKTSGTGLQRVHSVEVTSAGSTVLVDIIGHVDRDFVGFGPLDPSIRELVLNATGMTRMSSLGVRQWLKAMDAIPKTLTDLYVVGCPTFFVDQLNMVLNFGGAAQVLTVLAPYTCTACGVESGETIDVLHERALLVKGSAPDKNCSRCGGRLEFDETPESYFSFVGKYAASSLPTQVARLLASHKLYNASDHSSEKPPRIIKLVHGAVTYFRIIGMIGAMFRARPFLVGAEGEVVIDLAEVVRFDVSGQREWRRMLKSLAGQVPSITLVDANASFLSGAADSVGIAKNISMWSVLVPYSCIDCGRLSSESQILQGASWPYRFAVNVCPTCGGTTRCDLAAHTMAPLQVQSTTAMTPRASAKLIKQRAEVLSRARTDAAVAQAGEGATVSLSTDDTILGKYKIVRRLSEGGMAEVFLAKQIGIGGFEKPVALKRIQRQLLETRHMAIDMFLNEAKIAGRLMHPAIVQVFDVGEVGGALYLAMEYVAGKDLRQLIKSMRTSKTKMPLGDVCYIVREVAQALHHAFWSNDMAGNRLSVVHRDVSPHNVIISYDGAVKLLDFGVAMSSVTESTEKMIVGKWLYMSPEHTSKHRVGHRSDLFSLGVVLYLLCSGAMPFVGYDPKEIVRKVRAGQFTPLAQLVPDLPEPLTKLVDRMLSPDPTNRPETGREVASTLDDVVCSLGLECSAASLANFLSSLYGDTREPTAPVEIIRRRSLNELESAKIGIGSSSTLQGGLDDRSSNSFSLQGGVSRSMPLHPRITASQLIDASMSPTRRSAEFSSPQPVTAPRPNATRKTLAIILAILVLAIVGFFLIRPS